MCQVKIEWGASSSVVPSHTRAVAKRWQIVTKTIVFKKIMSPVRLWKLELRVMFMTLSWVNWNVLNKLLTDLHYTTFMTLFQLFWWLRYNTYDFAKISTTPYPLSYRAWPAFWYLRCSCRGRIGDWKAIDILMAWPLTRLREEKRKKKKEISSEVEIDWSCFFLFTFFHFNLGLKNQERELFRLKWWSGTASDPRGMRFEPHQLQCKLF